MLAVMGRIAPHAVLILVAGVIACGAASAQSTRTWVSGVGNDATSCDRETPCKTFAGAYAKTAAGGEINCLDSADFGPLTIQKSLTIDCSGIGAGIRISQEPGIVIIAPGATVNLSGLDVDGSSQIDQGQYSGILVYNAAKVEVRNSSIRGFHYGSGIIFAPLGVTSSLVLDNVTVADNGFQTVTDALSGGLFLTAPLVGDGPPSSAQVMISNSHFIGNYNAGLEVFLPSGASMGTVRAFVTGSDFAFTENGPGFLVLGREGNGTGRIAIANSRIVSNREAGISADTSTADQVPITVANTTITGNGVGVQLLNAGQVKSFGDNRLVGNTSNGAFTAPLVPLK